MIFENGLHPKKALKTNHLGRKPCEPPRIFVNIFVGDEALKQELLTQVAETTGPWHYGGAVQESATARAERMAVHIITEYES